MGDWRDVANCREVPANLMFPENEVQSRHAKMICSSCPVKAECLGFAQELVRGERSTGFILYGVWGGLTAHEVRDSVRRRSRRDTPKRGLATP